MQEKFTSPQDSNVLNILLVVAAVYSISLEIGYAGTERIVLQLALELVARGHRVTLLAARGSQIPGAEVIETLSPVDKIPGLHEYHLKNAAQVGIMMEHLKEHQYDVVHNHVECWQAAAHNLTVPMVVTHHNGWTGIGEYYAPLFRDVVTHVTISDSERRMFELGGVPTERVYNGVDIAPLIERSTEFHKQNYVALIGRFSYEKGFHIGISACIKAEVPVKIAAKLPGGGEDLQYYRSQILPLLENRLVDYVGPVNDVQKAKFLGQAKLLIVPNAYYRTEPFGLVVVEGLACGCPIVGSARGAVSELAGNLGSTFAPPEDEEAYIEILSERIKHTLDQEISPDECRDRARNFGIDAMVDGYIEVYRKAIAQA